MAKDYHEIDVALAMDGLMAELRKRDDVPSSWYKTVVIQLETLEEMTRDEQDLSKAETPLEVLMNAMLARKR